MSYSRNQYQSYNQPTYNSIRQNQTSYIVRQSTQTVSQRPMSYKQLYVPERSSYGYNDVTRNRNSITKINNLRKQFHDVIDLCKGQNVGIKSDLNNVVQAQRDIYQLIVDNPQVLKKNPSHQSIQQAQRSIKKQQTTPIMQRNPNYVPQSVYYIPHFSQVGVKQNIPINIDISNVKKPQSVYITVPINKGQQDNLQGKFNQLKQTKPVQLNDEALRLIEQIQKKSFNQIQKLRRQKLQLMQRLNEQIRNLNEEKRKNAQLQNQLNQFRNQASRPDGTFNDNTQRLQLQIYKLQNQLKRVHQLNNNIQLQVNHRGAGVSGIQELLRQGQYIRQQTLRLLRLKQQNYGSQKQQQLQNLLIQQQRQKMNALQEIRILKQKLGQSYGNFSRSKISQGPHIKSTIKINSPQNDRNSSQYDDLVSQMKRITGF